MTGLDVPEAVPGAGTGAGTWAGTGALVAAVGAPEYAGMPTVFQIIHRGREWVFPTLQVAQEFVSAWHPTDRPVVRVMARGGDGRPALTSAPDTVFVSKCTSTRWVDDSDEAIRDGELMLAALAGAGTTPGALQGGTTGSVLDAWVLASQRLWLGGRDHEEMRGFRVECVNPVRAHDGVCGFARWAWDWRAGTVNA